MNLKHIVSNVPETFCRVEARLKTDACHTSCYRTSVYRHHCTRAHNHITRAIVRIRVQTLVLAFFPDKFGSAFFHVFTTRTFHIHLELFHIQK